MKLLHSLAIATLLFASVVKAQHKQDAPVPSEQSTLNQVDHKGQKHGIWLTTKKPRMEEPGISEFGHYEHGTKYGTWYKINHTGDLISIENFRNNVLDGEVKYYEQGKLYCIGHYRGLNPRYEFDTIVVMNPITQEEAYRIIPTENGSLRHGSWKYFDPQNGYLIKEEEYQVDELVFRKDYDISKAADSLLRKQREAAMPHNKSKKAMPPAGKKTTYTEQ